MYDPFYDQSRMSKAWLAANMGGAGHMPLQAGLSNASQMSRHSQMTNYQAPAATRSAMLANNDRRGPVVMPPLVSSTPYSRQITSNNNVSQQRNVSNGTLVSSTSSSAYYQRNSGATASARYPRDEARAYWQPPVATTTQRQPVVAFNKTPQIFYEPQPAHVEKKQQAPPLPYISAPSTAGGPRSVPIVKRNLINPNQHASHQQSSGDSCCSSCCSLSSNQIHCGHHQQTNNNNNNNNNRVSFSSSFSCSSDCSCCSANHDHIRATLPSTSTNHQKQTVIVANSNNNKTMPMKPQQQQPDDSKTLTRAIRNRAERRRTIGGGGVNGAAADLRHQSPSSRLDTTPTPATPVYCNDTVLTVDRRANNKPALVSAPSGSRPSADTHTTSSRDSGIGATTPGSHSTYVLEGFLSKKQHAVQTQQPANAPGVGKTIAVAGDAETLTSTTIYATTVQSPENDRSSSVFMRMDEVRNAKEHQQRQKSNEPFPRNSSFSSSASSTKLQNIPPLITKKSAGAEVSIGSTATRVVPAGNDRYYWVDGNYNEAASSKVPPAIKPPTVPAVIPSEKKPAGPIQVAAIPPQQTSSSSSSLSTFTRAATTDDHRNKEPEKNSSSNTIRRSFFKNLLSSLFGIRPRQHSDGDMDDEFTGKNKRRPPNRSASAVISRRPPTLKSNTAISNKSILSAGQTNNSNKEAKSSVSFSPRTTKAAADRNKTWHGLKSNNKKPPKEDMRKVFEQKTDENSSAQSSTNIDTISSSNRYNISEATINNNNNNNNNNAAANIDNDEQRSVYTSLSKDDGSSTLGRPSGANTAMSTMSRSASRGASVTGTLKSNGSQRGPLFLVRRRGSSVTPIPPAAPQAPDPSNPNGEPAVIANVEQLLAMARVHPQIEYEWIPDDYFI